MAKFRHKHFQMYEYRDEAIEALRPHASRTDPEAAAPASMEFEQIEAEHNDGVTHVQFKNAEMADDANEAGFIADLSTLVKQLEKNSKVLLDFAKVESFRPSAIDSIISFDQKLRVKGSRVVICCLNPEPKAAFFK